MRSQIIITVEHGEDTDTLQSFVESFEAPVGTDYFGDGSLTILDYEVRVDVADLTISNSRAWRDYIYGLSCRR